MVSWGGEGEARAETVGRVLFTSYYLRRAYLEIACLGGGRFGFVFCAFGNFRIFTDSVPISTSVFGLFYRQSI